MVRRTPSMLRALLLALPVAALAPLPVAQVRAPAVSALPSPQDIRDVLALTDWTVQDLLLPDTVGAPFRLAVELGGMPVEATLMPRNLLAPGFKLLVQGADGSLHEEVPAQQTTYQGTLDGMPGSVVAGSLEGGQFRGLVRVALSDSLWGIQPATEVDAQAARTAHIVYDSHMVDLPAYTCGTLEIATRGAGAAPVGPGDAAGDKVCQIACDADFEYYQSNSSNVAATQSDITSIINGVDAIYKVDVGILYSITTIVVRTSEPDPYTSTDPNTLLNQFSSNWNSTQGSVVRDVAHMFTGKNIAGSVIGIAQLNVICNLGSAYGLVQSKYTGNLVNRYALSAHEIGHNWNATHCDGDPACSIMCSGLGGCSGNLTHFNTGSKNQILAKKASVGCLSDPVPPSPPNIASVVPSSAKALGGATMTVNGSFFATASLVTAGGQATNYTVVSDNQITFYTPNATSLGTTNVVVTTAGGTSNTKTYTTLETLPPQLSASALAFTFTPYTWNYGGGIGDLAFLLIGLNNTTFNFQGQNVLSYLLILSQTTLNGVGLGSTTISLPVSTIGLTFYSQVVTSDAGGIAATGIGTTFVWN